MMAMISSGRYFGRKMFRQGCLTCRAYCMVGIHALSKLKDTGGSSQQTLTMMIFTVAWNDHQAVYWRVKLRQDSSDGK